MPRSRSRHRITAGVAATVALALGAAPAMAADEVKITPGNPATNFTGTDKNTGTTTHNFVSIGTAGAGGQENNPVTSFTVNGQSCQLYAAYGSAYCQVNLPPGATINFSGTTQSPATTFSYCTSDNNGVDNDCNDVNVGSTTTEPPAQCSIAQSLLDLDVDMQRVITRAHAGTLTGSGLVTAIHKLEQAKLALITKDNFTGKTFGVAT